MSKAIFFIRRDQVSKGPFSLHRLQTLATAGKLRPTDEWRCGATDPWKKIVALYEMGLLSSSTNASAHDQDRKPKRDSPRSPDLFTVFKERTQKYISDALDDAKREISHDEFLEITDRLVVGRSPETCDWVIHDPSVSLRHAVFFRHEKGIVARDLGSRTGVVVNNNALHPKKDQLVPVGSVVRIGPAVLEVATTGVYVRARSAHAHLECLQLNRVVTLPNGDKKRILNDVSLNVTPGQLVVILGPSGSGKSTLLHALNGRSLATSGEVFINGENVYTNYEVLRSRMATVPQKDLLHGELSVGEALAYTAQLRLSSDVTSRERRERVQDVIKEVELSALANSPIRTLSGGQTKRVSLANELLAKPALLFIDEATSGLDEKSDREIMERLRALADGGKTIICITHNLGNVQEFAHQLVVMAEGGHLAFAGPPDVALHYFGVRKLGNIYTALRSLEGDTWAQKFRLSSLCTYTQAIKATAANQGNRLVIKRDTPTRMQLVGRAFRHGRVVYSRALSLLRKDRVSVLVGIAQPACIFALIAIVFGVLDGDNSATAFQTGSKVLFLLTVSAFWLGCNNSAKEIVKERELLDREINSGLCGYGYLGAKASLLIGITSVQVAGLFALVYITTGLPGNAVTYLIDLLAVAVCGVGLGLTISALANNTDVAATSVPLAVIPQVVLAGGVHPVAGVAEFIAILASPCYWCFGALTNRIYWATIDSEYLKEGVLEMNAQSSWLLSTGALALCSLILLTASGFAISGTKVLEYGRNGIEEWARGMKAAFETESY